MAARPPHPSRHHPPQLWRSRDPAPRYDAVIVGAGGHGLAAAYELAATHGLTDVAVLEAGWLAGGNMARNTTIVRSNYLRPKAAALYEDALQRWEQLGDELDYELLFNQCGVMTLAHNLTDVREARRRVNANHLLGIDAQWLEPDDLAALCPVLNLSPDVRFPVLGAAFQPRAGTAKHDNVAWAYARAADRLGVHLIEHCEVLSIDCDAEGVHGVTTTRGEIATRCVGLAAAGRTSLLTDRLGVRLPLQSRPLQALVSDLLEPVLPCVVMSNAVHVYVSQADKGELVMGAGTDPYVSYAPRGSIRIIEEQLAAALELFPLFADAQVLRTWAGIVDITPDASPIIDATGIAGVYVNCGWGTGGFKATPTAGRALAHLMATGKPLALAAPFTLDRFVTGALVDEHGAAGVAH